MLRCNLNVPIEENYDIQKIFCLASNLGDCKNLKKVTIVGDRTSRKFRPRRWRYHRRARNVTPYLAMARHYTPVLDF